MNVRSQPRTTLTLLSVAFLVAAACRTTFSQCGYEAEVMPWPPGYHSVVPSDMNESGVVVGQRTVQGGSLLTSAFRWTAEEGFVTLPPPPQGAAEWEATDIDAFGTIVGLADLPGNPSWFQIVRWPVGGGVELLSPANSALSYSNYAVLADGSVVGTISNGPNGQFPRPFWWRDGGFLSIPEPIGSADGGFRCAHPTGWAGGLVRLSQRSGELEWYAVLWKPDQRPILVDLLRWPFFNETFVALDKHLRACVVATESVNGSSPTRTYHWDGLTLLPVGPNQGIAWTTGAGMNELGQIVGRTGVLGGNGFAFLWQDGVFSDLSTLTSLPPGYTLFWAYRPLNDGVLLCDAYLRGSTRGVILRPQTVAEDVNVDCKVNTRDLQLVLEEWGPVNALSIRRADVNGDDEIDAYDLAEVLGAWSPVEPPGNAR
jgi:probable HAF family extracellular repeat protein